MSEEEDMLDFFYFFLSIKVFNHFNEFTVKLNLVK